MLRPLPTQIGSGVHQDGELGMATSLELGGSTASICEGSRSL
jgi:hypothetical protein